MDSVSDFTAWDGAPSSTGRIESRGPASQDRARMRIDYQMNGTDGGAPAINLGALMASFRPASNELFIRDFSDEKEIHSTPTSSRKHANTVGDRFRQRVRSSWFGGLLR
jgi:hypothetical protein